MQMNTSGLIIAEKSVGERDKIITILTEKEGLIRAFVQRAKNINNKNVVSTQLLCYSRFVIYKGRDKYIINEADIKEMFFPLREDIKKLAIAQYFCDLTLALVEEQTQVRDFLRLILNALYYLSTKKNSGTLLKAIVEMRGMSMFGYMPNIVCCKKCAKYQDEQMYFSPKEGAIYCNKCYNKNEFDNAVLLNKGALTALRYSVYADVHKLFSFTLSEKSLKKFSKAAEKYVVLNLQRGFKTLDFYNEVK